MANKLFISLYPDEDVSVLVAVGCVRMGLMS